MSRLLIKVCGMRDVQNIQAVTGLDIDLMGFIFHKASPRFVGEHFGIPVITTKKVGVFVNTSVDDICRHVEKHALDYVQLHGDETIEQAKEVSEYARVIKAFRMDESFNFSLLQAWEGAVNYFLFDTRGMAYGGTGKKFDWSLLDAYKGDVSFLLSGGIRLSDVHDIRKLQHPQLAGIDVNSGFEIVPAVKDVQKLKSLVQSIR